MDKNFIGRTKEIQQLGDICASSKAEFWDIFGIRGQHFIKTLL